MLCEFCGNNASIRSAFVNIRNKVDNVKSYVCRECFNDKSLIISKNDAITKYNLDWDTLINKLKILYDDSTNCFNVNPYYRGDLRYNGDFEPRIFVRDILVILNNDNYIQEYLDHLNEIKILKEKIDKVKHILKCKLVQNETFDELFNSFNFRKKEFDFDGIVNEFTNEYDRMLKINERYNKVMNVEKNIKIDNLPERDDYIRGKIEFEDYLVAYKKVSEERINQHNNKIKNIVNMLPEHMSNNQVILDIITNKIVKYEKMNIDKIIYEIETYIELKTRLDQSSMF